MIHHIALETAAADREPLVALFGLLGFEPVEVPPGLVGLTLWVEHGDTQVHMLFVDEPTVLRVGHVAVVCEDYDEALARLEAAGHAVERDHRRYWGAPRSFVTAPGGHRVEIMAYRPSPPYAIG